MEDRMMKKYILKKLPWLSRISGLSTRGLFWAAVSETTAKASTTSETPARFFMIVSKDRHFESRCSLHNERIWIRW